MIQTSELKCFNCGSKNIIDGLVLEGNDWIYCLNCHTKDNLVDYPVAQPMYEPLQETLPSPQIRGKQTVNLILDKKALELQRRIVAVECRLDELDKSKKKSTY